MEAVLRPASTKVFTRALTCLSKYGDELSIHANVDGLALSATNSAKTAYARFHFPRDFFQMFQLGHGPNFNSQRISQTPTVAQDAKGELLVKVLLSVFKSRAIEKTVEKIELEIYDGPSGSQGQAGPAQDELESKLIIRFHCKQGITKTHRLLLNVPDLVLAPRMPEPGSESKVKIGNEVIKEVLEHFSRAGAIGKGKARDPQLSWVFGDSNVTVKTVDVGKGVEHVATELSIEVDQFEDYEVNNPPVAFGWHLREFNASITIAETLDLPIELVFTKPGEPLFIQVDTKEVEDDSYETFFAIATSQMDADGSFVPNAQENRSTARRPSKRKPTHPSSRDGPKVPAAGPSQIGTDRTRGSPDPLFIPNTQLSQREQEILKESGLGDVDFEAMMGDVGEEVEYIAPQARVANGGVQGGNEEGSQTESDEEEFLEPSQIRPINSNFQPLFDD